MTAASKLGLVYLTIALAMVVGWGMNLYELIANSPDLAMWGGMEVARTIGVFVFPLGSLLGYF